MAILLHSIGYFDFHAWRGALLPEQMHHVTEQRPGVPGVEVWHVGKFGDEFTVETERLTLDYKSASDLFDRYVTLTNREPQFVVVGGVARFRERYQVRHVHPIKIASIVRGTIAGDSTHYQGTVVARWTLQAVALAPN